MPRTHIVSDLTYVRVGAGWNYVCLFIDLCNREIVGHAATSPIQALYETVRMPAKKHRGEFTPTIVLRLLREMPPGEAYRRYDDFGKRHGIPAEGSSLIC